MVFVCLCLICFTQHNVLEVHPCCHKWEDFILFLRLNNIPLCVYIYQIFFLFFSFLFFFFFGHAMRLAGSRFPTQELNLGHGSESLES